MPSRTPPVSETTHVNMTSGGIGSFTAGRRLLAKVGRGFDSLFTDTLIEDADLYRFLIETSAFLHGYAGVGEVSGLAQRASMTPPSSKDHIAARKLHLATLRADTMRIIPELHWIAEGRTPWEVFKDERFLGNNRVAICSRILKREMADRWLDDNCVPAETICYVGIDWTEEHRYIALRDFRLADGWRYRAPLCEAPYITKDDALELLKVTGIAPPRLYALGFSHNNCGGGCVRAGLGHFTHLHRALPSVYAEWEENEQEMLTHLERGDISILRDRTGGETRPVTLYQLRKRIESGHQPDLFEIGGCGCFVDEAA